MEEDLSAKIDFSSQDYPLRKRCCAKFTMHRNGFQTIGWAAFDRTHQQKHASPPHSESVAVDPWPTLPDKMFSSLNNVKSSESLAPPIPFVSTRTFSSVVQRTNPVEFPLPKVHTRLGTSDINIDGDQNPVKLLRDAHNWADHRLIDDILAAVNKDFEQASSVLKEMADSSGIQTRSSGMCSPVKGRAGHENVSYYFQENNGTFMENNLPGNSQEELLLFREFSVPAEPDWEENDNDDVYLSQRKEALKMMRAVTRHSKAAGNAYSRGDHLLAQQLSLRAREDRMIAEKLNAQAAEEILRIRNSSNGIWKLDLHGLHAIEAVHALKQRLHKIEFEMMTKHPSILLKSETAREIPHFTSSLNAKGLNLVLQQKQTVLHVITGTGNHSSKGQAALPAAVKSFLIDGGYRFDDAKPGALFVRPIFRYKAI